MKLTVNGKDCESAAADLLALWREQTAALGLQEPRGFAIALNGRVVKRADWPATPLAAQDRVEIIRAFAGG